MMGGRPPIHIPDTPTAATHSYPVDSSDNNSDVSSRGRAWSGWPESTRTSLHAPWTSSDRNEAADISSNHSRPSLEISVPRTRYCMLWKIFVVSRTYPKFSVFYRMYTDYVAIPSRRPVYSCDQYLGRILATDVAPPHTAASIKRHICKMEAVGNTSPATIFIPVFSQSPMNDTEYVPILDESCPGSTPDAPLALVVKLSELEFQFLTMMQPIAQINRSEPLEIRYCELESGHTLCTSS